MFFGVWSHDGSIKCVVFFNPCHHSTDISNHQRTKPGILFWALWFAIFLSAAYYREFFIRNLDEITSQVGTGEIDSTGTLQKYDNPIEFLYYFVSILDTQLGLFIGSAALICLIRTLIQKRIRRDEWSLVLPLLVPSYFFRVLQKSNSTIHCLYFGLCYTLFLFIEERHILYPIGPIGNLWICNEYSNL